MQRRIHLTLDGVPCSDTTITFASPWHGENPDA